MSWRRFFRRRKWDEERTRELASYLETETEENVARGMMREEAKRAAHVKLGNATRIREEIYEMNSLSFLETLGQDLRYGARMLRKNPGFSAIAILTLALGIGANTAIFSVVDAVLLKPLRFKNPSSLVMVWENQPKYNLMRNVVAPPNLFDWEQENHVFSKMAAFIDQPINLTGAGQPEQVDTEAVSTNFFSLLGVDPILGRTFAPDEDQPGKNKEVVLSYGLWKSKFGADPNIVGRTIQLNGQSIPVIGVMGPDFDFYIDEFSFSHEPAQLWAPLVVTPAWHDWSKVGRFLRVIARLNPGVSLAQAQAQMNVVAANSASRYPKYDTGWGVTLTSLRDQFSGALRPALLILLGAVGFVLLIACANISSLLLSRAAGRRREIAIRIALGASRGRITRQLLTESLLLGVIGGTLGAFIALWGTQALVRTTSGSIPDLKAITVDWRILLFTAAATLLAGLLAGFFPSFMATRREVGLALPEGGRTSSAGRKSLAVRSVFVVVEMSLALILLVGASLLFQSFVRLIEVDPGFRVSHLLMFQLSLPKSKYQLESVRFSLFTQLFSEIRALPGVISASADVTPPFSGVGSATDFMIVGEPPLPLGEEHGTSVRVIEPDYFRTMGIPLLRGRTFNDREFVHQSNVVVINERFADKYFRGKNPLGQRVVIDMKDTNLPDEIIGVVGNVHETSLADSPGPVAYWPYPEISYPTMTVVVRTASSPLSMVPAIRETLQQIDKDQPMAKVSTMDQLIADSVARSRFTMLLLSIFAGLALALACIGIYGVMAYSVAERTHEIGIRLALGAQRNDVLRLVLERGARLALIGVGIGVAGALLLTRLMTTLLYSVSANDPLTFAAVAILLMLVALLACYIPARRAMRVDPMEALRYE